MNKVREALFSGNREVNYPYLTAELPLTFSYTEEEEEQPAFDKGAVRGWCL